MRALVIGSGAREHALSARLASEGWAVTCAPGNAGIRLSIPCHPLEVAVAAQVVELARRLGSDLVVVGPEAPLVRGLADVLREEGFLVFGPSQAAARIEGSKAFAKEIMDQAGVPTARYRVFERAEEALNYSRELKGRVVVKADGIAAGKGVVVCDDLAAAEQAILAALVEGSFGEAGRRLILEERLSGPEVSLMAVCDGERAEPLPLAHDYKRALDGEQGPNTGGMGAVAPSPRQGHWALEALVELAIAPVLDRLRARGSPFQGLLYAGLMLTSDGPKVLEYNCRFGDPETQVVLPVCQGSLGDVLLSCARGELPQRSLVASQGSAVGVVACAAGYPGAPHRGDAIDGLSALQNAEGKDGRVYCGGVAERDGLLVTDGGRVATVVGLGADLPAARLQAYRALANLRFPGLQYRNDIGLG